MDHRLGDAVLSRLIQALRGPIFAGLTNGGQLETVTASCSTVVHADLRVRLFRECLHGLNSSVFCCSSA